MLLTALKQEVDMVHHVIYNNPTDIELAQSYTLTDHFYDTSSAFDLVHDVIIDLHRTSSNSVTNTINAQE